MMRTQNRTTGRTAGAKRLTRTATRSSAARSTNTGTAKGTTAARTTTAATATNRTTSAKKKAATKTGGREATKAKRGEEAPPSALKPIRKHQSRSQIIATVAADSGVERGTAERVARSLSTTLTRHLMRGGSGRVEIPYLGAALWRGRQAAQKPRTMFSPLLSRNVQIPARKAQPVARFRVHRALKEIVARV